MVELQNIKIGIAIRAKGISKAREAGSQKVLFLALQTLLLTH